VYLLCKNHADVNALTRFNRNGLHIAALRGHFDVVKVLVNNSIQVNAYDSDGNTALHFAAENGHRDIIVFLI
jgi:ankyrin repeat protein